MSAARPAGSQAGGQAAQGPIPAGVNAGLHTPVGNAGLRAWGIFLMLLGGAAGRRSVCGLPAAVPTDRGRVRRALVVLGSAAVLITGVVIARETGPRTDSGSRASSGALPAAIAGTSPDHAQTPSVGAGSTGLPAADRAALDAAREAELQARRPGVPIALDIPISTDAHPGGVHAQVTANGLNPDGTLHVPADPTVVSWAKDDAPPGSARGPRSSPATSTT